LVAGDGVDAVVFAPRHESAGAGSSEEEAMASAESGCGSEGEGRVRDLLPACGPPSTAAPRLQPTRRRAMS